jgi:single-stranded DNA-binding protein
MNQIKLSLRTADDPRTIKEEAGLPTFASVFSLHNLTSQGRGDKEAIPITVKASNELAKTIVAELKKGVAFVVEGQLAYYKNPDTNRENYSIWAESFTDITPPKSTAVKIRLSS